MKVNTDRRTGFNPIELIISIESSSELSTLYNLFHTLDRTRLYASQLTMVDRILKELERY